MGQFYFEPTMTSVRSVFAKYSVAELENRRVFKSAALKFYGLKLQARDIGSHYDTCIKAQRPKMHASLDWD